MGNALPALRGCGAAATGSVRLRLSGPRAGSRGDAAAPGQRACAGRREPVAAEAPGATLLRGAAAEWQRRGRLRNEAAGAGESEAPWHPSQERIPDPCPAPRGASDLFAPVPPQKAAARVGGYGGGESRGRVGDGGGGGVCVWGGGVPLPRYARLPLPRCSSWWLRAGGDEAADWPRQRPARRRGVAAVSMKPSRASDRSPAGRCRLHDVDSRVLLARANKFFTEVLKN